MENIYGDALAEINNLARSIKQELEDYSEEVDEVMQDEITVLSKELVKDLKNDDNIPKRTGKYKKSFYVKKLAQGQGYKRVVVANKLYQLTHLLENGHDNFEGGGRTRAFPHWAHAQKKADTLDERIARRLK